MGRRWLSRNGNYILKSNLPIDVQNMTLKSIDFQGISNDHLILVFCCLL